ncbi:polymerase [Vibrio sp. HA2012]|uniref:O-antigen ligase family protein n=1 Tax=Vibrio sp. HA2012 TaxID=1971595 RepID=UPI000C2BCE0B|nr:O-antigen ligase family protein [Vibrio sp. HA2012]PJC88029.1 polymerase [Vibrio sp. HA2012]
MSRIETACYYSFLLLLIWLPVPLASNRVWAWSIAEFWIACQTFSLIIAYRKNFPWHRVKRFYWLLIPLLIFQVWVALQLVRLPVDWLGWISPEAANTFRWVGAEYGSVSLDHFATVAGLIKGISYTLFAFNAVLLVNSIKRIKSVMITLVISGTFQAFYGAMMVLLGIRKSLVFGFPEVDIATGSFVYKNHLANYLMMVLSVGVGLIVSELHQSRSGSWRVRLRRWSDAMLSSKMMVRLALVIMVIALVMTRSRMGNSAFFAVTIIGGLVGLLLYKNRPRALTVLIISLLAIDTLIVGTVFGLGKVKERLEHTSVQAETRDQVVVWSLDIIQDFPVTGTGMGSYYSTFPKYTQYNVGFYNHAHNEYIEFAVEAGIPATLMLGSMVLFAVWLCLKAVRSRNSRTMKGAALGSLMAIVGMLIHISVDFNLQAPANALTFILILVLAGCSANMPVKVKNGKAL